MRNEPSTDGQGRGAQTKRKVLAAALEVVQERPLAEVQLQQIAERAGISAGHVLYHFGSKDQILVEVLRWSEDEIAKERRLDLAAINSPVDQLARWTELFLPRGKDDATWKLWLELWLRSSVDEEQREITRGILDRWISDLDEVLDRGMGDGTFARVDREAFVTWAHSLLVGLSIGVLVGWMELNDALGVALDSMGKELSCNLTRSPATS